MPRRQTKPTSATRHGNSSEAYPNLSSLWVSASIPNRGGGAVAEWIQIERSAARHPDLAAACLIVHGERLRRSIVPGPIYAEMQVRRRAEARIARPREPLA